MENNLGQQGSILKTLKITLVVLIVFGFISCIFLDFFNCLPTKVPFDDIVSPTFNYQVKLAKTRQLIAFIDSLGVILLIIGASYVFGSVLGFLFGMPHNNANNTPPQTNNADNNTTLHNDNLAQISDWLTKIIVGASLVSFNKIPGILKKLSGFLINQMGWSPFFTTGVEAAIFLYLGLGFATGYLWARIKFTQAIK